MNGKSGRNNKNLKRELLAYPIIVAATKCETEAMNMVLRHFSGYITSLSVRKLIDDRGKIYYGVDYDIHDRLQMKLMQAVLKFKL